LKYKEKDLFEIDNSKIYLCEKCKAKFNILKLNIAHKYFQCPKCKSVNLI
jgi:DNA-directed RNA polymerase subunit RPC12/RpoP